MSLYNPKYARFYFAATKPFFHLRSYDTEVFYPRGEAKTIAVSIPHVASCALAGSCRRPDMWVFQHVGSRGSFLG